MRFILLTTLLSCSISFAMVLPSYAKGESPTLDLSHILSNVYQSNPSLLAAREELKGVYELYPQAKSGWMPTVRGETSIFATDIDNSNFNNGTGATTKDLTLSLDQPIWRGGRTFAETSRARDLIEAGEAVLRQREQEVFLDTATSYIAVLRNKEILNLRLKNEDILRQEFTAAQDRKELGELTSTDVQQAQARLSRATSERITADNNYKTSKATFQKLVGHPAPDSLKVPYMDFSLPQTLPAMKTMARQQNPELLTVRFRQRAAEHGATAVERELFPQIAAFASYNKQYDPQPGIVDESSTQMIGVRASVNFFSGGSTRSRIREAKIAARQQEYEIRDLQRRIEEDVENNWSTYQAARALTENRKQEIDLAQQALVGVREEAQLGQRSVMDILDADEDLIDAKIALIQARCNEIISTFRLAQTLGLLRLDNLKTAH